MSSEVTAGSGEFAFREATLPLDAGDLYITWPGIIGQDEINSVEVWMHLMIRQMKSAADKNHSERT